MAGRYLKEMGFLDCIKVLGLLVQVNKIAGAPATCLFFGAFETFKRVLSEKTNLKSGFLIDFYSGFLAECVSCMLWVPIDVVKERLQIQNELKIYYYKNSLDAFK